jgi:hypothetical protein
MSDLVDNYLSRLQTRLEKRMPQRIAEERVREVEGHLRESVASRICDGNSLEQAAVEALQALGSDALLAEGLIRQHLGLNNRQAWKFAWLPCLALFSYGLVPWTINEVQFPTWIETFVSWNVSILVLSLGYACWRSRRFLLKPIAIVLGLVFVLDMLNFVVLSSAGFTAHSEELRKQIVVGFDQNIWDAKSKIAKTEQMRSDALNEKTVSPTMAPTWSVVGNEEGIAGVPFTVKSPPTPVLSLRQVPDPGEAKTLWEKNGTRYLRTLHGELNEAIRNQKFWRDFKSDPIMLRNAAWSFFRELLVCGMILAAFNALILAGQRAIVSIRTRLWRPRQFT